MKELLEKHPKSAKIVREYYLKKLLDSLEDKGLPDEFKEHVKQQGLPEEQIIKLLETNPGALTDVFDENGIYIITFIDRRDTTPEEVNFRTSISGKQGTLNTCKSLFKTRKEAEKEGVTEAFSLLEQKL